MIPSFLYIGNRKYPRHSCDRKHTTFCLFVVITLLVAIIPPLAGARHVEFVKQFGTIEDDRAEGIAVDTDSDIYVVGSTFGNLANDTDHFELDAFIRKSDAEGSEIWTRQFGPDGGSGGKAVAADPETLDVYVSGETIGTFANSTNSGDQDVFLAKFDKDGNEIWVRQFGTSDFDAVAEIATDTTGVYLTGWTRGVFPDSEGIGINDGFITKFDVDGNQLWMVQFGTEDSDSVSGLALDNESVFISGETFGEFANQTNLGETDLYISKFDKDGNSIWSRQFGTEEFDFLGEISIDSDHAYVVGSTYGAFEGEENHGSADIVLSHFDKDGNNEWTRQFGTSDYDTATALSLDPPTDSIFIIGNTEGKLQGEIAEGGSDVLVSKVAKEDGETIWSRQIGTAEDDFSAGLVAVEGRLYLSGFTYGAFSEEFSPEGFSDAFFASIGTDDLAPPDSHKPTVELDSAKDQDGNEIAQFSTVSSNLVTFQFTAHDDVEVDHSDCSLALGDTVNLVSPCESPITFENLMPGNYVFSVNVTDTSGNHRSEDLLQFTVFGTNIVVPSNTTLAIETDDFFYVRMGVTLQLESNSTVLNNGVLVNDGTINIATNASIVNNGTLYNNFGASINNDGQLVSACSDIVSIRGNISGNPVVESACTAGSRVTGIQYEDSDSDGSQGSGEDGVGDIPIHLYSYEKSTGIETVEHPGAIAVDPYTNLIYVVDGDRNVSILNGTTHELMESIDVGFSPASIAVDPERNLVYVAISQQRIVIIDARTNEEIDQIQLTSFPVDIVVNPFTDKVYVLSIGLDFASQLTIIDAGTQDLIESMELNVEPTSFAVNLESGDVFISNTDNSISILDEESNEITGSIDLGFAARSMAIDPVTNTLYAGNIADSAIYVMDLQTRLVEARLSLKGDPGEMKLDNSAGLLYVADNTHGIVYVIDTNTRSIVGEIDPKLPGTPLRIGVDQNRAELYVTSRGIFDVDFSPDIEGGITLIDDSQLTTTKTAQDGSFSFEGLHAGTYVATESPPILHPANLFLTSFDTIKTYDNVDFPGRVAVNPNTHQVYVVDSLDNAISVFDGVSDEHIASIPVGESPSAVVTDPTTNFVYVSNYADKSITILDASNAPVATVEMNHSPADMAIDPAGGKLYITNPEDHLVSILDTESRNITKELQVGDFPMSIVIDPETDLVYVSDAFLFSIHVINGQNDTVLDSIPIGSSSIGGIGYDPDSKLIYVPLFDKLLIVNVESGVTIESPATADQTNSAIFDPSSDLVLVSQFGGLAIIDGDTDNTSFGNRIGNVALQGSPSFMAIDPGLGKIYAVDTGFYPDFEGSVTAISGLSVQNINSTDDLPSENFSVTGSPPVYYSITQPTIGHHDLELGPDDSVDGIDFGNSDPDDVGTLTVDAHYFDAAPANGMPIDILRDGSVIAQGLTPVTFVLQGGQDYTVVAHHIDSSFFSSWSDNGFPGISRDFTLAAKADLHFEATYANIPGADVIEVNFISEELVDDSQRPLEGVRALIESENNIRNVLDSGLSPKVFHLANGITYRAIAVDSKDFVFDHWNDPATGEPVFSRSLKFTAEEGLTLNAVYRFSNSTVATIPVKSELLDGTELTTMFNKVYRRFNETDIVDRGFTPNEYHLEKNEFYTAVASDFRGLVLDHWEANSTGFFQNYTVYSNEIEFYVESIGGYGLEELTAVYRIVDEEDFASVRVDEIGDNVEASAPTINQGVDLTFDTVVTRGNVTLAQIPVVDDPNLFETISEAEGIANVTIPDPDGDGFRTYVTSGPVVRINTATLTLEGERQVTLHYDPTTLPSGVLPRILHFNGLEWEDVTTDVDTDTQTVTGSAETLSPLVASYISTESKFGVGGIKGVTVVVESGGDVRAEPSIKGVGSVVLQFENVTTSGNVDLTTIKSSELEDILRTVTPSGGSVEVGSKVEVLIGAIVEVDASAIEYKGDVVVTIPYDPDMIPEGGSESDMHFLHYTGSQWKDETIDVDVDSNRVTGELSSLSPIVAAMEVIVEENDGGDGGGTGTGGSAGGGGGGGGGTTPTLSTPIQPTTRLLDNKTIQSGANVTATLSADKLGVMSMSFENVTAAGNIILNMANITDFKEAFMNSTGDSASSSVDSSQFVTLGKIYNISKSAALEFSGNVAITVPYNGTTDISEETVRLLQLMGKDEWRDITTSLDQASNMVSGVSDLVAPVVVVTVPDGTFGDEYFKANPLSKFRLVSNLSVDNVEDQPVLISVEAQNMQRFNQSYVFVVQVVNSKGQAVFIDLVNGQLPIGSNSTISSSWTPDKQGNYSFTVMLLSGMENPELLCRPDFVANKMIS